MSPRLPAPHHRPPSASPCRKRSEEKVPSSRFHPSDSATHCFRTHRRIRPLDSTHRLPAPEDTILFTSRLGSPLVGVITSKWLVCHSARTLSVPSQILRCASAVKTLTRWPGKDKLLASLFASWPSQVAILPSLRTYQTRPWASAQCWLRELAPDNAIVCQCHC